MLKMRGITHLVVFSAFVLNRNFTTIFCDRRNMTMKKVLFLLLVAGLLLGFGANHAAAQTAGATVTGKAVRWNGEPIVGATIQATTQPLEDAQVLGETRTGADGSYTLSV